MANIKHFISTIAVTCAVKVEHLGRPLVLMINELIMIYFFSEQTCSYIHLYTHRIRVT